MPTIPPPPASSRTVGSDTPPADAADHSADGASSSGGTTRLTAKEIHRVVHKTGDEELERPISEVAWSALAAGLALGFSLVAGGYLASLAEGRARLAAAAVGYPLGFVFVVLARSLLFTENTLFPVIPLLRDKSGRTLRRLLRLWAGVLAGNLVGALLFALLAARTMMVDEALRASMLEVARHATEGTFGANLWRAVFGGWLIAFMAWLVSSTRQTGAQIVLVWLATAPIAAFGFRH